jgi:membrane associated rhomboid family serine protease
VIPFRDENPTRTFPLVVVAVIAANVVVFLYQSSLPELQEVIFTSRYGAIPAVLLGQATPTDSLRVMLSQAAPASVVAAYLRQHHISVVPLQPIWLSIFTSMFLHGGWLHLGGNMLYLWIFGNNVEDILGHIRFLVFYLICGAIAAALQVFFSLGSIVPMIGASGAIAGVLGAYYLKFPRARVQTLVFLFFFVTVIWLPAGLLLLIWFLGQLLNSLQSVGPAAGRGGVAFFAHIGGFAAGYLLIRMFEPRRRRPRRVEWWP